MFELSFIPNPENKPFVDHIDNNGFNNHISNLRWATNQENQLNVKCCRNSKSGIRGVHFNTRQKKWVARYSIDKKQIHIGYFNTIEEATEARKKKLMKHMDVLFTQLKNFKTNKEIN